MKHLGARSGLVLLGLTILAGCGGGSGGGNLVANVIGRALSGSDPVAGAVAQLTGTTIRAVTADDGTFTLTGVPAGNWTVSVEHASGGRLRAGRSALFAFDGSHQVNVGDVALASINNTTTGLGEVTGTVLDQAGDPAPDFAVELRTTAATPGPTTRTGPSGGFALRNVAPGTYSLVATGQSTSGAALVGQRDGVVVGSGDASRVVQNAGVVVAQASRMASLQGQVTDQNEQPIVGARVAVEFDHRGTSDAAVTYVANTNAAGRYLIGNLPTVSGGVRAVATANGFTVTAATVTLSAGGVATRDFQLSAELSNPQNTPANLEALALTWPLTNRARLAAAAAARHRALGGRLARFVTAPTRLAPNNHRLEIQIAFDLGAKADTAGSVLYRSHQDKNQDLYVAVARSDSPQTSLLADLSDALSVGTKWFYRVAAIGARGNESSLSGAVSTTPLAPLTTTAPTDQATGVELANPTFRWTLVSDAKGYQVLLWAAAPAPGDEATFTSPPLNARTAQYRYEGPALTASEEYFWCVVGYNHDEPPKATAEVYSALRSFTTAAE